MELKGNRVGPLGFLLCLALMAVIAFATVGGCREGPDKLILGTAFAGWVAEDSGLPGEDSLKLTQALREALGIPVQVYAFDSQTELVRALGAGRADIAVLGPYAYVLAHDTVGARVILRSATAGWSGTPSQVIALASSRFTSVADLAGKLIGFVDPASPGGYLFPMAHLIRTGLGPSFDSALVVFLGSEDEVVRAVIDGRVAAGACPEGALARALASMPGVDDALVVITETPPVPGLTVAVRAGLDPALADRVKQAIQTTVGSGEGRLAWLALTGTGGVVEAQNADYDVIREMCDSLGIDVEVLAEQ